MTSTSSDELAGLRMQLAEEAMVSAELLLNAGQYRSAVSRAYYTVFHAAKALLTTRSIEVRKHSGLLANFGKEFVKTGQLEARYSDILFELFRLRSLADYQEHIELDPKEAQAAVRDARDFLEAATNLLKESGT